MSPSPSQTSRAEEASSTQQLLEYVLYHGMFGGLGPMVSVAETSGSDTALFPDRHIYITVAARLYTVRVWVRRGRSHRCGVSYTDRFPWYLNLMIYMVHQRRGLRTHTAASLTTLSAAAASLCGTGTGSPCGVRAAVVILCAHVTNTGSAWHTGDHGAVWRYVLDLAGIMYHDIVPVV